MEAFADERVTDYPRFIFTIGRGEELWQFYKLMERAGRSVKARVLVLAEILALAAVYVGGGRFGLSLAFVNASASAVWPPTGIALAALLLRGNRLWPGVFLGALVVNILTPVPVGTAVGIAIGNTLEAVLGAWLVNRFAGGWRAFERTQSIFKFVLLAAMASTVISASLGVICLCLSGGAHWDQYWAIWLTWWMGDMVSDVVVAPLLLIWFAKSFIRHAPAPCHVIVGELPRFELRHLLRKPFVPVRARVRRRENLLDNGPSLAFVSRKRPAGIAAGFRKCAIQSDGVFKRHPGAGTDRKMNGPESVSEQHAVFNGPAPVIDQRKLTPDRFVR